MSKKLAEKVAIATTTFYNPNLESDIFRAQIAKNTIRNATDLGYEIIVVDGGSSEELLREFERYGAILYAEESKGMGPGRRQAMKEACKLEKEIIAWTEPEKEYYIPELIKTVGPIMEGHADLVVPKRKSLKSYPTAQQFAEPFGNDFWKKLTKVDLDMWFGPRTWRKDISYYFLDYNGEYGDKWDSIFIPVMNAVFDDKKVISVEVDYTHPQKQTEIEEHNLKFYRKRIEQLENLMNALESHWKKLHGKL